MSLAIKINICRKGDFIVFFYAFKKNFAKILKKIKYF